MSLSQRSSKISITPLVSDAKKHDKTLAKDGLQLSDDKTEYPLQTVHTFLNEASDEFRRYRIQARLNFVGSIFLLFFLIRLGQLLYETAPYRPSTELPLAVDGALLVLAFVAVGWSLNVWYHQRKFISKWGSRFERLTVVENELLPDEKQ